MRDMPDPETRVHETKGYRLTLIAEPMQSHVVSWEKAARATKNEDAKPILNRIMAKLQETSVAENNLSKLAEVLSLVSAAIAQAVEIINDNETLTLSANHGAMVKAAIKAGWIISLERIPPAKGSTPEIIMGKPEEIDGMKPWVVTWIAEAVAKLYLEATTIPKN